MAAICRNRDAISETWNRRAIQTWRIYLIDEWSTSSNLPELGNCFVDDCVAKSFIVISTAVIRSSANEVLPLRGRFSKEAVFSNRFGKLH